MKLFDVVVLLESLSEADVPAGSTGTVVEIFEEPRPAYEVEFVDGDGETLAVATVRPEQVQRRP
ncbi:DUF4926 domain-containing protein [Micromonospora sp. WMMD882]|uniref:DUF4926 domain-containing protein n=1 Tax=Micromonospora sp. WMMD882 TaxID=3015151 RepID=UPI00248C0284|nr:DUF4926 domain-containing protein [Micromonospora sp. WMMD882]WBB82217.1 DUF4926 domain-containing protein [Micromonospora sp. WMMD882]